MSTKRFAVYQLELNGKVLNEYPSVTAACGVIGVGAACISLVCTAYRSAAEQATYPTDPTPSKPSPRTVSGYAWCFVSDYRGPEPNRALFDVFPELEGRDLSTVDFDKIRPSMIKGARPIWQIEIDGTRIKLWSNRQEAAAAVKGTTVANIGTSILSGGTKLCGSFWWSQATYDEIVDPQLPYSKQIPSVVCDALKITTAEGSTRTIRPEVVILLKQNVNKVGDFTLQSRPVVRLTLDGESIDRWPGSGVACRELKLPRGVIDGVVCGNRKSAGGFGWRYMTDEEIFA